MRLKTALQLNRRRNSTLTKSTINVNEVKVQTKQNEIWTANFSENIEEVKETADNAVSDPEI